MSGRLPILYLAPWVGYGGSDKNTIDWFRWLDRDRFAPSLITTQPSPNPLLSEVEPYAEEIWVLPDLMPANEMPGFILDFVTSRGVAAIHLMNSKLGFDLLPELARLPAAPAVVVQMHAEEADRSGYVRYVTTRSADLVDCFSLSNEPVADAVREYGVPEEKIRVIYTGVDADGEFDPTRVEPAAALERNRLQILFAARLVAQKDPLLMLEVARALGEEGVDFQIRVIGEGDMEDQIEAQIRELGLEDRVILHGPAAGLRDWYAACDVLLLTSTFEGIPVVIFEAMSMGLPIVTAGLPAISGLLGREEEGVVSPRDSVSGYVEPLVRLARDSDHLAARGAEMRARAGHQFSVQQMAAAHGELYQEVVAARGIDPQAAPPRHRPELRLPIFPIEDPELGLAARIAASTSAIVGLTSSTEEALLESDAALVEKALRRFEAAGDEVEAIALTDAGEAGRFSFRALPTDDGPLEPVAHTVLWRRPIERHLPGGLCADSRSSAASVAWLLCAAGTRVEWRHLAVGDPAAADADPPREWRRLFYSEPPITPRRDEAPHLVWKPPRSRLLVRYRRADGSRVLAGAEPPPGCDREHVLGALRDAAYQGTVELPDDLGYLEAAPLPGLDSVAQAVHRESGEVVTISLPEDPLLPEVEIGEHLGFIDPQPLLPRETPSAERPMGLLPLTKSVDIGARRHRYAIGAPAQGDPVAELGSLSSSELGGSVPVWIVDDWLVTEGTAPPPGRLGLGAARWTVEPVRWGGLASVGTKLKVGARRAALSVHRLRRPTPQPVPEGPPQGWLFDWNGAGMTPLYASYHPVTNDQLLSRHPETAAYLGYGPPVLLGFLRAIPNLTGTLDERVVPIPWARRFGHVPRPG